MVALRDPISVDNAVASGVRRKFDLLGNPPGFYHVRLLANNLDTLCADFKTKGIIVEGPSVTGQGHVRIARLCDPDGNNLVFIEQDKKK